MSTLHLSLSAQLDAALWRTLGVLLVHAAQCLPCCAPEKAVQHTI